jgi:hypothetical protein
MIAAREMTREPPPEAFKKRGKSQEGSEIVVKDQKQTQTKNAHICPEAKERERATFVQGSSCLNF